MKESAKLNMLQWINVVGLFNQSNLHIRLFTLEDLSVFVVAFTQRYIKGLSKHEKYE